MTFDQFSDPADENDFLRELAELCECGRALPKGPYGDYYSTCDECAEGPLEADYFPPADDWRGRKELGE